MRYQYFGLVHWQPTIDGYSGFVPPHHRELGLTLADFPSERALAALRGLDVGLVIVHSELMDAFQPGRISRMRAALEQTPGIAHEGDFGPDWVYRIVPAEPVRPAGRFWSTDGGQAFLILSASNKATAALRPDQRIEVAGTWRQVDGGKETSFTRRFSLPLLVSDTAVVPLALPMPDEPGAYTLTLRALRRRLPGRRLHAAGRYRHGRGRNHTATTAGRKAARSGPPGAGNPRRATCRNADVAPARSPGAGL